MYAMNVYGVVEVWSHSFLTLAQYGGEGSPSRTRPLYLRFLYSRKLGECQSNSGHFLKDIITVVPAYPLIQYPRFTTTRKKIGNLKK
jgi:hypothetical protein